MQNSLMFYANYFNAIIFVLSEKKERAWLKDSANPFKSGDKAWKLLLNKMQKVLVKFNLNAFFTWIRSACMHDSIFQVLILWGEMNISVSGCNVFPHMLFFQPDLMQFSMLYLISIAQRELWIFYSPTGNVWL